MNNGSRRLLFVSPRFLFPTDSGGKIRTTQILRGLKGGAFDVELVCPGTSEQTAAFGAEIRSVCDKFTTWSQPGRSGLGSSIRRGLLMFDSKPVSVASDHDQVGAKLIAERLAESPDVVVFDFPHAAVLAPDSLGVPSVMFTHNIETEIFKRHVVVAKTPIMRAIWQNQHRKMERFEQRVLADFDGVVAVSQRDCEFFANEWGIRTCRSIPTGVDTEFFQRIEPSNAEQVVFCGSMDWMANVDGIEFFHNDVWPLVRQRVPQARMKVVGRTPPASLVRKICTQSPEWEFTGFVDDVRDHVAGSAVFVIPLRVGGGTRIKAFEAMAMGCPVVSTSIGIEGLPITDGEHYLEADEPEAMAQRIASLLEDGAARERLSIAARELVEARYGFRQAARVFEEICLDTIDRCSARDEVNA